MSPPVPSTADAPAAPGAPAAPQETPPPRFGEALGVWLKIGLIGFGGPAGQIALMHRIVVDEKRWIDEARFLHALNFCMLLPGPEAQQLATYLGWLLHRVKGGLAAGLLFVLPGAVVMLGLSILFVLYAGIPAVDGLLFGIKCAVVAVVIEALVRIGRRALVRPADRLIACASFIAIFFFAVPFPLIVLAAAVLGVGLARYAPGLSAAPPGRPEPEAAAPPADALPGWGRSLKVLAIGSSLWFLPTAVFALWLGWGASFTDIGLLFSKLAVVTFGGAYAVLAYVAQQAVDVYGWLNPDEMLTGLGLAETTPGPLIMVVQFVAFLGAYRDPGPFDPLVAGVIGGLTATWVTFAPCFLWIFLGAPYIERLRRARLLSAALAAITAAVVGVILNLALWFALHVLFGRIDEAWFGPLRLYVPDPASLDPWALLITLGAAVAMLRFHAGMLKTLALAGLAGLAIRYLT
jgi:chromate transporter